MAAPKEVVRDCNTCKHHKQAERDVMFNMHCMECINSFSGLDLPGYEPDEEPPSEPDPDRISA